MTLQDIHTYVRTAAMAGAVRAARNYLERFPFWLLQFVFRLSIAAIFWNAGLTKVRSWQSTLALFHNEYHVPLIPPDVAAHMATAIELSCPILLLLGLATRLASLPMLAQTLVIAIFVYPEDWIEHLTWVSMLLLLVTRGAGRFSIDELLNQYFQFDAAKDVGSAQPPKTSEPA